MRNYYSHKVIRSTSCYYFLQWHFFFSVWNYYRYILIFSSFHTKRQNCGIFNSCKTRHLQCKPKISCCMYRLHFLKCVLIVWILPFQRQRDFGSVSQSSDNSTGAGTCFVDFNENHNFWLNLLHCYLHKCHLF